MGPRLPVRRTRTSIAVLLGFMLVVGTLSMIASALPGSSSGARLRPSVGLVIFGLLYALAGLPLLCSILRRMLGARGRALNGKLSERGRVVRAVLFWGLIVTPSVALIAWMTMRSLEPAATAAVLLAPSAAYLLLTAYGARQAKKSTSGGYGSLPPPQGPGSPRGPS